VTAKVNVAEVGHELLSSLRELYHYPCQHSDDTMRTATLLSVYLFLDQLSREVYDDFAEMCEELDLSPDVVLEGTPDRVTTAVADFFTQHIVHHRPDATGFVFNQVGLGEA